MLQLKSGRFFGETARLGRFSEFTVTASRYRPGERLPRHSHESAYLFVMIAGGMTERLLGRDNDCTRGWLTFNEAGEDHDDRVFDAGAEGLNIEMSPRRQADLRDGIGVREPVQFRHAGPAIMAIGSLQLALRRRDRLRALAIEESIVLLLDSPCRPRESRQRPAVWLLSVEEQIRNRNELGLSLDDLAAGAGVHPAHLCREFRRAFGCTMTQYAARLRADSALQLVLDSDAALSTVAARTGFADQAHSTRAIRRHFGATPGRLRREFN